MNRKPQPADSWWSSHQTTCNGTFEKLADPLKADDKFKGKGRTWSSIQPKNAKVSEFFNRKSTEESSTSSLKCVNCTEYETESLRELNEHLDACLIIKSPSKKVVIDLSEDK